MSLFLKRSLVQILMVSSLGMLVKSESTSKLLMKLLEFCWTFSVAMFNESLTVYLLLVNGSKIDTKYFASFYLGVCKANWSEKWTAIDKFFMHFTRTIHYSRPSYHWFQMSSCFFRHAVRVNKLFKNFVSAKLQC